MHNPLADSAPKISPHFINDFRREMARELELKDMPDFDKKTAWLEKLPGGKEFGG